MSQVATRAIGAWLDAQVALRRQIEEAAAEAGEGMFVSREAVEATPFSFVYRPTAERIEVLRVIDGRAFDALIDD